MSGLSDLDAAARKRVTSAFEASRRLWGSRAALARELRIDPSTLQALEGRRDATVSDDMIERATIAVGWQPGAWRRVAEGTLPYDSQRSEFGGVDRASPMRLEEVPTSALLAEIARRTGS